MLNEDGSSPTFHNLVSKEDTYNTLTPIASIPEKTYVELSLDELDKLYKPEHIGAFMDNHLYLLQRSIVDWILFPTSR